MAGLRRFAVFVILCLAGTGIGYLLWALHSGAWMSLLSWTRVGSRAETVSESPAAAPLTPVAGSGSSLRLAVFYPGPIDPSRAADPEYARQFARIVHQFDLVAVHGFRGPGRSPFLPLLEAVCGDNRPYQHLAPVPVRDQTVRQFAVVFFNADKLIVDRTRSGPVEDPNRVFRWTPLVVSCAAREPALSEAFTFTAVIARVDPLRISAELDLLADLLRTVLYQHAPEDDIVLLAHLEADEETVARAFPEYVPAVTGIPNSASGGRLASNILFHPAATCEFTGRAGVLTVDDLFRSDGRRALEPLYFLPVWAEFSPRETPLDRLTASLLDIGAF